MDFQQAYQDLIWAAKSPSLVTDDLVTDFLSPVQKEQLGQGDFFEAFHQFLNLREGAMNHKVGLYFELLVEFLISDVLQAKMIHRGQQVVENGRTVGEVDFIFEHDSLTWHLETAVKFYLFVPAAGTAAEQLVGPNSNDSFAAKMDRLFSHQLTLSQAAFPNVTKRAAFVKGRIFYPHDVAAADSFSSMMSVASDQLSAGHETGVWCRAADCHDVLGKTKLNRYEIRRKPHWLADAHRPITFASLLSSVEMTAYLSQHFQKSNRPLMLSSLRETDGCFAEVDRIFVVDDTWP